MGSRTTPIPANPPSSWAASAPPVISLCALLSALSRPCSSLPCTQVLSHDSKVLAAATCSAGKATHGAAAEPVIPHVSEANPDARSLCHRPWRPSLCRSAASVGFCLPCPAATLAKPRSQIVRYDSKTWQQPGVPQGKRRPERPWNRLSPLVVCANCNRRPRLRQSFQAAIPPPVSSICALLPVPAAPAR